jgi:hypothetical protein
MSAKHKIGKKSYECTCGDGCCSESGYEWYVNGELVHASPCEDNGWLAVLKKLGVEVTLVGLNKDREEIWEL